MSRPRRLTDESRLIAPDNHTKIVWAAMTVQRKQLLVERVVKKLQVDSQALFSRELLPCESRVPEQIT